MPARLRAGAAAAVGLLAIAALSGCGWSEDREAARVERALSDVVGDHGTVDARTEQRFTHARTCNLYVHLDGSADDDLLVEVLSEMDMVLGESDLADCWLATITLPGGRSIQPAGFAPRPREDWEALVEYARAAEPQHIYLADPSDEFSQGGVRWNDTGSQNIAEFAAAAENLAEAEFPDRFGDVFYRIASGPAEWSYFGWEIWQHLNRTEQRREVLAALAAIEGETLAGRGAVYGDITFEEDVVTADLHIVDFDWYSTVSTTDVEENDLIPGSLAEAGAKDIAAYFAEDVPAYRLTVKTVDVEILSEDRQP